MHLYKKTIYKKIKILNFHRIDLYALFNPLQ